MSNIKINKILSQKEKIIIDKGYLQINSTQPSVNSLSGSLVLHGGLGINNQEKATSSSCGGGVTISGGLGVMKNTFFGGDLELDSNASIFRIKGITKDRMFMDTINNKNFYISLDGFKKQLELTEKCLFVNYTQPSENTSTASLVVSGGLSINSRFDSVNTSQGGSLTVGGGGSFLGDLYIGKNIYVSNSLHTNELLLNENLLMFQDNEIFFIESKDILNIKSNDCIKIQNNAIIINDNQIDFNNKTFFGSNSGVVFDCEVEIKCTNNSYDTSKGALSINGGLSVSKNVYIGGEVLQIPIGNTKYRPNYAQKGSIRYNNETEQFEGLGAGNAWGSLGGVIDIDQDTKIIAEKTAGEDNDSLEFYTDGEKRMTITNLGNLFIGKKEVVSDSKVNIIYTESDDKDNSRSKVLSFISLKDNFYNDKNYVNFETNKNEFFINTSLNKISFRIGDNEISSFTNDYIQLNKLVKITNGQLHLGGIKIQNDSDNHLNINNQLYLQNGKLGVSTDIPKEKLSVLGNIEVGDSSNYHYIKINSGDNAFYINSEKDGVSLGYNILQKETTINSTRIHINDNHFGFYSGKVDNNRYNEKVLFYISENGRIGINSSKPEYHLDINGTLKTNDNVLFQKTNEDTNFVIETFTHFKNLVKFDNQIEINDILTVNKSVLIQSNENEIVLNVKGNVLFNSDIECLGDIIGKNTKCTMAELNVTGNTFVNGQIESKSVLTENISVKNDIQIENNIKLIGKDKSSIKFINNKDNFYEISYTENDFYISNNEFKIFQFDSTSKNVKLSSNLITDTINSENANILNLINCNTINVLSTTGSSTKENGAIVVNGGIGIRENINVGGNAIISGSLTVLGRTNYIETTNTVLKDNIILLNSAPIGSKDGGIVIQRYQEENDNGEGDVVNDDVYISLKLNSLEQDGLKLNEIRFPEEASVLDNYYTGWWIRVASGFSANQIRKIISYDGYKKIAVISKPWTTQNPVDTIHLYKRPYVGLFFNEMNDRFEIASTLKEPESQTDNYTDTLGLKLKYIVSEDGYRTVSDARKRTDVTEYDDENVLDKIDQIKSIKYTNSETNEKSLGFLADELKEIFPELVKEEDYTSIDYSKMTVILLQCIKELKKLIKK